MPKAKKKTQPKRDPLIITAIVVAILALLVEFYRWWDPSDVLNMISTVATSIFFAVSIPFVILVGVVFWIMMLIDSIRREKYIWSVFIFFGSALFGLLYFLVEKPKIIRLNIRPLAWAGIVIFLLFWLPNAFWEIEQKVNPPDEHADIEVVTGTFVSKQNMSADNGPGVYTIKTSNGNITVDVGPHQLCDPEASSVAKLVAGQKVVVYAQKSSDKYYSVCNGGTYIKAL